MTTAADDNARIGRGTVRFLSVTGAMVLLTAVIVNPWAGRLWRGGGIVNYRDAMFSYFVWSLTFAALIIAGALLVRRFGVEFWRPVSMFCLSLSVVILPDRLLLAKYGRRLFVHDSENGYRYRANTVKAWGPEYGNRRIRTNCYGFRDDTFPTKKEIGEFRALVLGDSVAMGHGVAHEETFCSRLETMLLEHRYSDRVQVINAAVQGYATDQEFNIFRRSLGLGPDLVVVAFCMNDVTEPFVTDSKRGGVGIDYHGVVQTSGPLFGYLWNETGYGRLVQRLRYRRSRTAMAKREEVYNVGRLATSSRTDTRLKHAWTRTLGDLRKIYDLARQHHIPVVLIVFPFTFQIMDTELRAPQEILLAHARENGVDAIDLTPVLETCVFGESATVGPADRGQLYHDRIGHYFLDEDHLTAAAHEIVAARLLEYVRERKLCMDSRTNGNSETGT